MTRAWLWFVLGMGCGGEETFIPEEPPPLGGGIEVPDTQIPEEELPCSTTSGAAATLNVQNELNERAQIYWRDSACAERLYFTLGPGEGFAQGTYTTHVWVARREADGRLIDHHTVTAANETWSLTP